MLWTVHCPTSGTVGAYVINFTGTIKYHLERGDVYLIFGRDIGNSTKQMTISSRPDANRKHQVILQMTLTQNVALNVVYNKVQLINLVCHYLINHIKNNRTKLVTTGKPQYRYTYGTILLSIEKI